MPIYNYRCSEGHITEHMSKIADREQQIVCECGNWAHYTISAPSVKLEGITGDFPGAYAKWEKNHMQKLKVERKRKYG